MKREELMDRFPELTMEGVMIVVDEEMEADEEPVAWKGIGISKDPEGVEKLGKLVNGYYVSRAMWEELWRRYDVRAKMGR